MTSINEEQSRTWETIFFDERITIGVGGYSSWCTGNDWNTNSYG